MSWNEPGGDNKDPWSGRDQKNGPPDLDEVVRSLQNKLGGILGDGGDNSGKGGAGAFKALGLFALVALILWGLSGFYIVDEGNRGVVTRFGRYVETTMPGLNWRMPKPIEAAEVVNVEQQRFLEVGYRSGGGQQSLGSVDREALMLTSDENIVNVRLAVQYQVKDAKDYLFKVVDPTATLKQVTESAERGVIGKSTMDFVLTEGRTEIVAEIKAKIQGIMDAYESGIRITSVNLQDAQPPEEVQGAFEDAIKAREDKQRFINEAEAYRNDVIPKARGAAARQMQEAEGYKARVVARAEGEASRFTQLLGEYRKAPEVTRKRLYLEAMESVLAKTSTVMIDVKGGNSLMYLPLDKIAAGTASASRSRLNTPSTAPLINQDSSTMSQKPSTRGRGPRGR